jgi:adenylate cyclase, class 2
MREIEIKLRVEQLEPILQKLLEIGCALSEPIEQHDLIYSKKGSTEEWENSKSGHIVMRIRRQKDKAVFNLKQQKTSELDNIELESVVSDPKAIDQILNKLGYEPRVEVKKIRQKGKHKDYEICIDKVEKLGSFVELEKMADDNANVDEIREQLFKELEGLGLNRNNEETRGYDTQIFQLEHPIKPHGQAMDGNSR